MTLTSKTVVFFLTFATGSLEIVYNERSSNVSSLNKNMILGPNSIENEPPPPMFSFIFDVFVLRIHAT